jgi:hypothetical protein
MHNNDIDLRSVHWEHGMLLTPEHFLRQERYIDSTLLWLLRYGTQAYGLVGAGPRAEPAARGAATYDPVIDVHDDEDIVKVSVSQCRGLSASGDMIDIDPSCAIHQSFPKRDFDGQNELGIYVVCTPHDKMVEDSLADPANPQMQAVRRRRCRVQLGVAAAEAPHSLLLGRMRKSEQSQQYEKVNGFIPLGTTLASHSELMRAWERLKAQLVQLTDCYTTLHKAIIEYIRMASQRGVNTRQDDETLQFVGRMVVTLENCAHEILDPLQPPQQFFQQLHRAIRSAAVYLDLSPPTTEYFQQLAQIGEAEFDALLAQEQQTLLASRELTIHDNLSLDVQRAENAFAQLRRLEEALEGKYMDFRVSPALEALNFFFDRRSDLFYQSIARPARPQQFHDEFTFVFAALRLEGKQRYRLILISMPEAQVAEGDSLRVEIRFNVGAGQPLGPVYGTAHCEMPGQRNFAIDFDAPAEVLTIADLRVTMQATRAIKSCVLYERRFLYPGATRPDAEEPQPAPQEPAPQEPAPQEPVPQESKPVRGSRLHRWKGK